MYNFYIFHRQTDTRSVLIFSICHLFVCTQNDQLGFPGGQLNGQITCYWPTEQKYSFHSPLFIPCALLLAVLYFYLYIVLSHGFIFPLVVLTFFFFFFGGRRDFHYV